MNSLLQDLRYALRLIGKSRGFAAATIATLALGIGANTAVFSIVRGVLWKPLPFREPERLVGIWEKQPEVARAPGAAGDIADWQAQNRTFDAIAFSEDAWFGLSGRGDPERFLGARVSPEFFSLLGVGPQLGRALSSARGRRRSPRGGPEPRVLAAANSRAGAKRSARSSGSRARTTRWSASCRAASTSRKGRDFWTPLALTPPQRADRDNHTYQVVGRLRRGVSPAAAAADLHAIETALQKAFPETNAGHDVYLLPLDRQLSDAARPALLTLFGAVAFVLLIACANVANLLLARALDAAPRDGPARRPRRGPRTNFPSAADRERPARGRGRTAGSGARDWSLDLLVGVLPLRLSEATPVSIDGGVLIFTLAVSVATGILFGLGPAIAATRPDAAALAGTGDRSGAGAPDRGRLRHLLVVAEIALALVLLVGAGLMLRTVAALQSVDPGFPLEGAATFEVALPAARYASAEARRAFCREALRRLEALPGVSAAGATNSLPMGGSSVNGDFRIEGRPPWPPDQKPITYYRSVTPDFFRASQIPVRRGRAFREADREGAAPVAMVNETMVRRFFPGEDPLGKRILVAWAGPDTWREIVGVVADIRGRQVDDQPVPETYVPFFQYTVPTFSVIVRTAGDPAALFGPIRREVRGLDGELPVSRLALFDAGCRPHRGAAAPVDAAARPLRRPRDPARRARAVERPGLRGRPEDARDRNPDRRRSAAPGHPAARARPGDAPLAGRDPRGAGRRLRPDTVSRAVSSTASGPPTRSRLPPASS